MKEYALTLIGSALVCSLVYMIAPEGKLGKYVNFAGALCILCVAISPIYSFISGISGAEGEGIYEYIFGEYVAEGEDEVYLEVYEENLMSMSAENMSVALVSLLCRETGVDAEDIEVYVELESGEESFLAKKVSVVLYGSAVFLEPREISGYIESLLGCECEIIYG